MKPKSFKKKSALTRAHKKAHAKNAVRYRVPTWIGKIEECGSEINLGQRRIYQLAKEGFPKAEPGLYDIVECFRWYVRYLQQKLVERALAKDGEGGRPASPAAAAIRHTMLSIESELKQIELAKKREELISIEKVNKDLSAIVAEIRRTFRALPRTIAVEIIGETDLAVSQVKIERMLKEALWSLSEYDPDLA